MTDDPNIEYYWNDWIVRYRDDNRSGKPWTVEHTGQRMVTRGSSDGAKAIAEEMVRERSPRAVVQWRSVRRATPITVAAAEQPPDLGVEGRRLLEALEAFVRRVLA